MGNALRLDVGRGTIPCGPKHVLFSTSSRRFKSPDLWASAKSIFGGVIYYTARPLLNRQRLRRLRLHQLDAHRREPHRLRRHDGLDRLKMWLPDNTVSEIGKNSQTKWKSGSFVTVP